jgi:hypothetical protein
MKNLEKYGIVRSLPAIDQNLIISDSKTGIQGIRGKFDIANPKEQHYTLFSSNASTYIIYLNEIFEKLWKRAEKQ